MSDVRAITVKQPWAWAIAHGGKTIENRSAALRWRGTLLIHAGASWSDRGAANLDLARAWGARHGLLSGCHPCPDPEWFPAGVVAVARLVGAHVAEDEGGTPCCSPWGELTYARPDGTRMRVNHLVLADVRALDEPVPARGRLGLWRPDADLVAQVAAQIPDLAL